MNINLIALVFLYVTSDFVVVLQSPGEDLQKLSTTSANKYASTAVDNPGLKSLWWNRPPSLQLQNTAEHLPHRVVLGSPHIVLTRLVKPLSYGYDPFFRKHYFEPFERRKKPVTLIAFRKHGILPQRAADPSNPMSSEVAELQSSFNEISNFWQDDTFNM